MVEEDRSNEKQQSGKESPLTVGPKPAESTPPSGTEKPVETVGPQGNEGSRDLGAPPRPQQPNTTESELVRELQPFERKTLKLGVFAVVGAFVTAVLFLIQIKVTSHQNQILSSQAISGVAQAIAEERNTSQQLKLLRKQAKSAQGQVDAIKRQMRLDQRPWLYISNAIQLVFEVGKPVGAAIQIKNVGKTPAEQVYAVFVLEKVKNGVHPNFIKHPAHGVETLVWFRDMTRPRSYLYTGAIFANDPSHQVQVDWLRAKAQGGTETINFSTQDYDDTAVSGSYYFALHGVAVYRDVFNIEHWTQVCGWGVPSGGRSHNYTAADCGNYNQVDSNE